MNGNQVAHLVLDYRAAGVRAAGKGIIDIYGGVKWGWHVQAAQS